MTTGPDLLLKFLSKHGASQALAARVLGVSAPAVNDWVHNKRTPSAPFRSAIERWTDGAVPAMSWLEAEEVDMAELLGQVQPLQGIAQEDDGA